MKKISVKKHSKCKNFQECLDCGFPYPIFFILEDELWESIASEKDILCFECTEVRLGRSIVMDDLKDCGITEEMLLGIRIFLNTNKMDIEDKICNQEMSGIVNR